MRPSHATLCALAISLCACTDADDTTTTGTDRNGGDETTSGATTPQPASSRTKAEASKHARFAGPLAGVKLPVAQGAPIGPGLTIHLTPDTLQVDGEQLVTLSEGKVDEHSVKGHLIHALYDSLTSRPLPPSLAEAQQSAGHVFLAADERTPFATLVDVLYTSGRAGRTNYSLIVRNADGTGYGSLRLNPPRFEAKSSPDPRPSPSMSIELTPGAFTLFHSADAAVGTALRAGTTADYSAITNYAKAIRSADPEARQVVVSATPDTELGEVVAALNAARGPGCVGDVGSCLLPDVVVQAGGAHASSRAQLSSSSASAGTRRPDSATSHAASANPSVTASVTASVAASVGTQGSPRVRQASPQVRGPLDRDVVRRVVRAHINEVRSCYEQGLATEPALTGRISVGFEISATGVVTNSQVASSTLDSASVSSCISRAVGAWKFPRPEPGSTVKVVYPFILSPN